MTSYTAAEIQEALESYEQRLAEARDAYMSEAATIRAAITKIRNWLWEHGEHTADSIAEEYIALRDKRHELKQDFEEQDRELKEQMHRRDVWLLEQLNTIGADSIRAGGATVFLTTKVHSNCADWPTYWNYIKEHDRFDLLEKRVSQAPIANMLKEGEPIPPGINTYVERTVTVRRSN